MCTRSCFQTEKVPISQKLHPGQGAYSSGIGHWIQPRLPTSEYSFVKMVIPLSELCGPNEILCITVTSLVGTEYLLNCLFPMVTTPGLGSWILVATGRAPS